MNLLYSPSVHRESEANPGNFMENYNNYQKQDQDQDQDNQLSSSGQLRYRSTPSSFFENLVNGGLTCDNYQAQSTIPETTESLFADYMSSNNGSGGADPQFVQHFGGKAIKQEETVSIPKQIAYANGSEMFPVMNYLENDNNTKMDSCFGVVESHNLMQVKPGTIHGGLVRQKSSPAGFLYSLSHENGTGFSTMRNLESCNPGNVESKPSTTRMRNDINFSSGSSSHSMLMPQNDLGSHLPSGSWNNNPNVESRHRLISQSSLPNTSSEMAAIEKYLHFQGSVPCKIRAKRGHATHPRSIAERVRRTRISHRMKKLEELFPNLDKHTNTAEMLEMAVGNIKKLQKQVKNLTDITAKCTCSGKTST